MIDFWPNLDPVSRRHLRRRSRVARVAVEQRRIIVIVCGARSGDSVIIATVVGLKMPL